MSDFDFSPFSRSSVGFDRMFNALESSLRSVDVERNWPPYNIARTGEGAFRIELAVAGFSPDELSITAQQNLLIVAGQKGETQDSEYLHRGIMAGSFERRFSLADYVKVKNADFTNGILSVDLVREIPEEMKPRRVEIGRSPQQDTIEHKAA